MIEFTKGDLFGKAVDIRVNTVNCKGVMGKGVALAFKNRYPEMFKEYRRLCTLGKIVPGYLHVWKDIMGNWIINFPTKLDWKEKSRYEYVALGLKELKKYLSDKGNVSVALPALGCGNGGLDWSIVSKMIAEELGGLEAYIYVYEPSDSVNAGITSKNYDDDIENGLDAFGLSITHHFNHILKDDYILIRGNKDILNNPILPIITSKTPDEKESDAINNTISSLEFNFPLSIALNYHNSTTLDIVNSLLRYGFSIIIFVPSGPQKRDPFTNIIESAFKENIAIVYLGRIYENWTPAKRNNVMRIFNEISSTKLITDPDIVWVSKNVIRDWVQKDNFYIKYALSSEEHKKILDFLGARPLGRRQDDGRPNTAPLSIR
ncbi:macro domain-containing protein [Deinococcus aquaticus]|uniref:macro domain-containing protein n=1 Tax=Deinococcus aquaticus TaxID=328692 RepID=UPI00361B41DF